MHAVGHAPSEPNVRGPLQTRPRGWPGQAGEIRDRYENQQHRASGLNLVVTAIILWNTHYLERAVANLRQTEEVPEHALARLSPVGWERVNLTGDYIWAAQQASENIDGLRPLRAAPKPFLKAA